MQAPTRIEDAYIHFCWYGEDADTGSVKAILPPGFEPIANYYAQPRTEQTPDGVVLSSPKGTGNPAEFFVCTEAVDPDRYAYTYLAGDDGRGLVTIAAWPADGTWAGHMISEAEMARPWLEEHLGGTMPLASLTVREVSTQGRRRGGADLVPVDGVVGISEAATDPGVLSVPLARTWLDPGAVSEPWLAEGLAMWTGHAAVGSTCPEPIVPQAFLAEPALPGADATEVDIPDLSDWVVPGPIDDEPSWDRSRYQSALTCGIVEAAAESIGEEAMTAIIADLLTSPGPVSATDWLVAVAVASDTDTVT